VTAGTKLDDYIEEVRSGYNDEQRAHLDATMRHYDRVSRLLEQRLERISERAERTDTPGARDAPHFDSLAIFHLPKELRAQRWAGPR
jgi:hypothetical protein